MNLDDALLVPDEEINEPPIAEEVEPQEPESDPFNGLGEVIHEITRKACMRIDDIRTEWGWSFGSPVARARSLGAWRQYARMRYAGDVSHRALLGGVFGIEGGNLSQNTTPRIIRLLAAQHAADLVGTDPFVQAMPSNIDDPGEAKLSKQVERKVQDELSKSNAQSILAESIRVALNEGERAIKIVWDTDETYFTEDAEVMVDESGAAVMTRRGQYIFPKDDWITIVAMQVPDGSAKFVRRAKTNPDGSPLLPKTNADGTVFPGETLAPGEVIQLRLKKEPSFIQTVPPKYKIVPNLLQKLVNWNGLRFDGLFGEDFLYPATVPSLRDPACDLMAHCYDAGLEQVLLKYRNAGFKEARLAALSATGALSAAGMPLPENGERLATGQNSREVVNIHETYYRAVWTPAGGQPIESWFFIVIDFLSRLPIYAQLLGRMKLKRPPFMLLRGLESVPGRAYGIGVTKKFHDREIAIDVWFNRAALKSSQSSSITLARKSAIKELKDGTKRLEFGTNHVYELVDDGVTDNRNNPAVQRINLNEMSDKEFELMEKLIQSGEAEFGVVDAGDGTGTGKDSLNGGTATAIRNIERTGNALQAASKEMQGKDIAEGMEIAVDAILENTVADEEEWIPGYEELATLSRDEVRNLRRDIKLLPSRAKGADMIELNQAAKATILEYYDLPMAKRLLVRDQYIEILRNYNVKDADEKLEEPTPEQIQAEAEAPVQPQPPSVNVRLADIDALAPSERDQFLQKYFGIRGAPAEELLAMANQKQAMELEKASLKVMKGPGEEEPTGEVSATLAA